MNRYLEIDNCHDCVTWLRHTRAGRVCQYPEMDDKLIPKGPIPDWCPLPTDGEVKE